MKAATFGVLANADRRLIWRDPLLKWVLLLPIGLALLLRILLPRVQESLLQAANIDIVPLYPLILGGYLMTGPGIVGMVVGFLLLDERDGRTLAALRVTPLSMKRYVSYRVSGPLLVATITTLLGYRLIGIAPLPFMSLFAIAVVGALSAPLLALVLAAVAPNKVAGFAAVKVLNAVNLLPVAAYFLPKPLQYLAGVIPAYWPMRAFWSAAIDEPYAAYLAIGSAIGVVAVVAAGTLFERELQ